MKNASLFWPVIILFFIIWTLRVLYLPAPVSEDASGFITNNGLRVLLFFGPILISVIFIFRQKLTEAFALTVPSQLGVFLGVLYSSVLILFEILNRSVMLTANPWMWMSFPIAPVIEELVFRGFIFTRLLKVTGSIQTILLTSILFTLIHFPGWIFILGLRGEGFIEVTGQVFVFSLIQGVIRYYSKSVCPNILVHLVNNIFLLV